MSSNGGNIPSIEQPRKSLELSETKTNRLRNVNATMQKVRRRRCILVSPRLVIYRCGGVLSAHLSLGFHSHGKHRRISSRRRRDRRVRKHAYQVCILLKEHPAGQVNFAFHSQTHRWRITTHLRWSNCPQVKEPVVSRTAMDECLFSEVLVTGLRWTGSYSDCKSKKNVINHRPHCRRHRRRVRLFHL